MSALSNCICRHILMLKPCSHCPGFQSQRRYGVGPHRSDTRKHCIEAFTRKWTRWFQFFKTTRTHRVAKQRLFPGHHRSSSGMNHISTVRPSGKTVANRHKLCPWWRYGDSRLGHGVSQSFNPSNLK